MTRVSLIHKNVNNPIKNRSGFSRLRVPVVDIIAERIRRVEGGEMLQFPRSRKGRKKKKKSVLFFPSQFLPMSPLISCLFLETLKLKQGEKKREKGTEKGHEQE